MHPRSHLVTLAVLLLTLAYSSAPARDLASIPWHEFKQRSDFVFEGLLVKAELLDPAGGRTSMVRYTYKIRKVFKGQEATTATFDAALEEDINKTVGHIAIIALRKVKNPQGPDTWQLSIDQRSCWTCENKMAAQDFHGIPILMIPTTLITHLPPELSEEISIKVPYGDEYRDEKKTLFPMSRVEEKLKTLLVD